MSDPMTSKINHSGSCFVALCLVACVPLMPSYVQGMGCSDSFPASRSTSSMSKPAVDQMKLSPMGGGGGGGCCWGLRETVAESDDSPVREE